MTFQNPFSFILSLVPCFLMRSSEQRLSYVGFVFFYSATLPSCIKLEKGGKIQDRRLCSGPAFASTNL